MNITPWHRNMILSNLQKNTSFKTVMQKGKKWVTPSFIVFLGPTSLVKEKILLEEKRTEPLLLRGVVASKKVGNAVHRNRAKRRLREIVRLDLKEESSRLPKGSVVILVARKGAITSPFETLQKDFRWALKRLMSPKEETTP